MQEKLIKEAKKYGVRLEEYASLLLASESDTYNNISAREWIEKIQSFLDKHKLDDARIVISLEGHDSYLNEVVVEAWVEKSEETLQSEIELVKETEKAKKSDKKKQEKKREEEEYKTYLRLQKKFQNRQPVE